jgi:protein phosphatase
MSAPIRKTTVQISAWAVSDQGTRDYNEDAFLILKSPLQHIVAVCDGMGGHAAGEVASGLAVETLKEFFSEMDDVPEVDNEAAKLDLHDSIATANRSIHADAQANPERQGMGSTCVVGLVRGHRLYLGHVGDSRAYLVRGGGIRQLTRDHSFVEEMVKAGMITPHETHTNPQRNVILQSLGRTEGINIDIVDEAVSLREGDYVLLCSDGLTAVVADQEIAESVERDVDPKAICEFLVDLTNRRGAPDNVTVAILRYDGEVNDGPHVCLLCSDSDSKDLYRLVLRREGYRLTELGVDAVSSIPSMPAAEQPRLVIVDEVDAQVALDACRTLRGESGTSGIPLLLVSDGGIEVDVGREAGASHVLANSALLSDLSSIIRRLLEESTALIYVLDETAGRTDDLVRGLRDKGFIVIPHSSPEALSKAVAQQKPQMLMLDITRGVERLCQQLKRNPATARCPIVLTAEGAVASTLDAHAVGADYYLTKAGDAVTLAAMLLSQ